MLHEPAPREEGEDRATAYKMRLGAWMFLLYGILYGIFIAINVIRPALMAVEVFLGLNLAIAYGFGLIVFALALALVYNRMCLAKERELNFSEEADA